MLNTGERRDDHGDASAVLVGEDDAPLVGRHDAERVLSRRVLCSESERLPVVHVHIVDCHNDETSEHASQKRTRIWLHAH